MPIRRRPAPSRAFSESIKADPALQGWGQEARPLREMIHQSYGGVGGWGGDLLRSLLPGSDYDYQAQAGDLWRNSAVAACLRVFKVNFPQPELTVRRIAGKGKDKVVPRHNLVKLINRPNKGYDRYALWSAFCTAAVVDGNAYLMKVRSAAGIPVELWWVPPWMLRPLWDSQGADFITAYQYQVNGRTYLIRPEDIIHYRHGVPDPRNDRSAMSELKAAAARTVCGLNEIDGYTASIMRNMGIVGVYIRPAFEGGRITREDGETIKDQWRERTTGERRGDPFINPGTFIVDKLGFSPEELSLDKIPARLEDQVCALTGVPAMLAGLTSGAQHKTYCLPADARVWTPMGPVRIADVEAGQIVWSFVGGKLSPRPVLRSGKTGNKILYEIRTKNRTLRASGNHPILVRKGGNGVNRVSYEWKRVDQLTVRDSIVQVKSLPETIPSNMPDGCPATSELMQFLGAVIGDGVVVKQPGGGRVEMAMPLNDRSGNWYRNAAPELFVKHGGAPVSIYERPRSFAFASKCTVERLEMLGFGGRAKTKRIPGWVFSQTESHRLVFLAGIVDTDGTVDSRGSMTFACCNKDLTHDVRDLMISVGIQCCNVRYQQFKGENLPNPGRHEFYDNWGFTASSADQVARIPFTDPLYRERVNINAGRFKSDGKDAIKTNLSLDLGFYSISSIKQLPPEDVYDIEVYGGHSFVADGVVVHNSNYGESRRGFYEDTLIPMQAALAECLEHQLLDDPGMGNSESEEIAFSYDRIICLTEDQDKIWTRAVTAYEKGLIKRSEGKDMVGLEWDETDEVYSTEAAGKGDGVDPNDEEIDDLADDETGRNETKTLPGRVSQRHPFGGPAIKDQADRGNDGNFIPGDPREDHEDNTYGLPDGTPIRRTLKKWFKRIGRRVLGTLPAIGAPIPHDWPALADYTDPMASSMTPLISAYWDESGKMTRSRLGLDPDQWQVVDPNVHRAIETQSHNFCATTLASTAETMQDAYRKLNDELMTGIIDRGEAGPELTKRVQSIFTGLTKSHASMIARTETARAVNAASLMSARDSGVVERKKWLTSTNSCPVCHAIADRVNALGGIPLGEPFATGMSSKPEYADIPVPPAHPRCRCALTMVLTSEYQSIIDANPPPEFQPGPWAADPERNATPKAPKVPKPKPVQEAKPAKLPAAARPMAGPATIPPLSKETFKAFGSDKKAMDDWAYKNFKPWSDSLSKADREALADYGGILYRPANARLRAISNGVKVGEAEDLDKSIARIKSTMTPLPESVTLWRGADAKAFGSLASLKGKIIEDAGFVSASLDRSVSESEQFMKGVLVKINAPAGTPAASIQVAAGESNGEREILLAPATKFRVTKVRKIYDGATLVEVEVIR